MNQIDDNQLSYNFYEFYYVIKKRYKLILLSIFCILFLTFYYTYTLKPIYQSNGIIMVNPDQKSISMLDMNFGKNSNFIENELRILKSRTTSDLVINKLLESDIKNDIYLFNTKIYKSSNIRKALTLGILDKFDNVRKINSNISDSLFRYFSDKLRKSIKVSNYRNTDAIIISVKSYCPDEASFLTNSVIDIYKKRDLSWVTGEMTHLKIFLIDQISKKEVELNQIEGQLKTYQEEEMIYGLDHNTNLILENMTTFEAEYNRILASIDINNEKESYLNQQLTEDEKSFINNVSNTINERLIAIKNEIKLSETELISTYSDYRDEHQAVTILKKKINSLRDRLKTETQSLISQDIAVANPILYRQELMDSVIFLKRNKVILESKSIAYKKLVDEYSNKLSLLPEKTLNYTKLERIRNIHSETYSFMRKKLEEARIGEASKLGKIRIIDHAIPNKIPIEPRKKINILLGIIFGIIISFILVFILEYLDNTIKSIEQIERRNLAVLAIIPSIRQNDNKKRKDKKRKYTLNVIKNLQRRLITHEDPKSPVSEAYRGLRTSLMYVGNDRKSNIILISSSGPGEGKTTTIANLAIAYANLGKKTLLIDSDLRKPVLHNVFQIEKTPGLTNYLTSNIDLKNIINKTNIKNLDVITSGIIPPNPSEILSSKRMKKFVEIVNDEYNIILFDTPPLIAVTDAFVLLQYINQFILVVRAGVTQKGALDRVLVSLKQSKVLLSGVVMNAMTEEHSYGAGYYYNYYQYYYSDSED